MFYYMFQDQNFNRVVGEIVSLNRNHQFTLSVHQFTDMQSIDGTRVMENTRYTCVQVRERELGGTSVD